MNEISNITKELNQIKRQYQRTKTYFALTASHYFDQAVLTAQCAKPTTFEQAKSTSDKVNFFFKRDTTAYDFMQSVEETVNKSIQEYENFQTAVSIYPFEKRSLTSFAKWYAHSGFEVAMLKCNIGYIIHFGLAIQERNIGKITEHEMWQTFANIVEAGDDLFTFHPGLVMKTFLKTVAKFEEIENKVMQRKYDYE
jgi:predicted phosphoadenosine phosphosulfate sulfurtransferase